LAVLLAKGCLPQSEIPKSVTAGLRGVGIERRPLLGIELWVVEVLLLGIEVIHRCFSLRFAMVGAPQPNTFHEQARLTSHPVLSDANLRHVS
jgi:hypothetical protein